jgi:hypothetical protein
MNDFDPTRLYKVLKSGRYYCNGGYNTPELQQYLGLTGRHTRKQVIDLFKVRQSAQVEIYHKYDQNIAPVRAQLLDSDCWTRMCASVAPWDDGDEGEYQKNAVACADVIFVIRSEDNDRCAIIGFLLALSSDFVSPLTGKSVCAVDELYLPEQVLVWGAR